MGRRAKPAKTKAKARKAPAKTAARDRALAEAREQQQATSEILRVIATSPGDLQPVLDAVVRSAARLCHALDVAIFRVEGDGLRLAAHDGVIPSVTPVGTLAPGGRGSVNGRAVLEGRTVHVPDLQAAGDEFPEGSANARRLGWRATLIVPLLREGTVIGTIAVRRTEARPFSDSQVALLQTFADQAVIAIENARLLSELQERNLALTESNAHVTEALEQQTATSEILRVISRSPTDVQPVFDMIAESAARLCEAQYCFVYRFEDQLLHFVAHHGLTAEVLEINRHAYPAPPSRMSVAARAVLERGVVQVPDVNADPDYALGAMAAAGGYRSAAAVPILRDGLAVGSIAVTRAQVGLLPERQIELMQTFADQAVIAIENVRLFTELQTSNRDLTTALDTQTATADILRVISGSRTDVQPVFDAIVQSARRLLNGFSASALHVVGDQLRLAALTSTNVEGDDAVRALFPIPLNDESMPASWHHVLSSRQPHVVIDTKTEYTERHRQAAQARGYRSQVIVPMLREGVAVGLLFVTRVDPGRFDDAEIELLKTFADQGAIAIENARLLSELQARTEDLTRSVGELRALGEIGQAIGSTLDLQTVLATIVARATELAGADAGVIYEYDTLREVFEPRATERLEAEIVQELVAAPIRKGQGATGQLAQTLEPVQLPDIATGERILVRDLLIRAGYRALLALPLAREGLLIGALTVFRKTAGDYAPDVVELLQTFATQSALAIQNARLFREIEIKSRELEVASQHKSEFLASMSHELRTPLNAVIGFSEVLLEKMFGDVNDKQEEYLRDIHTSAQHLLSLINDILDLSKIEAGRMDLDVAAFDLPTAIDDALLLMRERAGRRGITLERQVDERLGEISADQRKVKQVLLNLLSNAVKFTPEGGRIDVRAGLSDGTAEISVTDTGIGIAPEDHDAVFEEFRQVGKAEKKAEGTGLGLALCRKFVELHGGRIWVKSQLGAGSTFTFTLPLRA